jgi:uncharacterized protein YjbI with pentapeptide repeats
MGKGADLQIVNNRSDAVTVSVSGIKCMYNGGSQGSNLSVFNATVQPGASLPASAQYIEADASGSCWDEESYFTLTFKDPAGQTIGTVQIGEESEEYYTKGYVDTAAFNVGISGGDQYHININVLHPAIPAGPVINQWILSAQNRVADIWYNQNYTVYGLTPATGPQGPGDNNLVSVHNQGGGMLALECGGGYNAYASVRDDNGWQVQYQAPGSATWITQINVNETLQAVVTADGYFALYSPHFNRYIQINPQPDSLANNCNVLVATGTDLASAARFSALGQQHNSIFDLIQVAGSAAGMSFAGIDLTGHDLSNANLTGCDFTQAVSVSAGTFTNANLTNAKFGGVSLDLVKLAGANCNGADFTGATLASSATPASPPVLTGANLSNAHIQGTLAGANLTGANLTGATVTSTADLTGANLTGVTLSGAVLDGNLTNANLTNANLAQVNLATRANPSLKLTGANLSGADLTHALLPGANLSGTTLAGTDFTDQDLSQVTFSSPLNQSTDPAHPTVFRDCTLPYSVIGLNWSCLDLTGTVIPGLPTSNLANLNAHGMQRPGADFSYYILDGADFSNATLNQANFTEASLRNQANFSEAVLVGAEFTQAVLDQASFRAAALGGVTLSQAANFSFAFVSNCDFTAASLFGVIFAGATLISGNVLQAGAAPGLQQADFSNAYLPDADFTGTSLQGAKFDGAFMVSCTLDSADLSPTEQGSISSSLAAACLQGASFSNTKLAGANLANAAITNTRGMISQQYYDENGDLTTPTEMRYQAADYPVAASFSNQTMCPNDNTYGSNVANSLTIAQMMTAKNPPTSWAPKDQEGARDRDRDRDRDRGRDRRPGPGQGH